MLTGVSGDTITMWIMRNNSYMCIYICTRNVKLFEGNVFFIIEIKLNFYLDFISTNLKKFSKNRNKALPTNPNFEVNVTRNTEFFLSLCLGFYNPIVWLVLYPLRKGHRGLRETFRIIRRTRNTRWYPQFFNTTQNGVSNTAP